MSLILALQRGWTNERQSLYHEVLNRCRDVMMPALQGGCLTTCRLYWGIFSLGRCSLGLLSWLTGPFLLSFFCLSISFTISLLQLLTMISFCIQQIDLSNVKSSYVPFAFDMRRKSLRTISVIKVFDYVLSPRKHQFV